MTVGSVWIPLSAELTKANMADSEVAPKLLNEVPEEVKYVLAEVAVQIW